MLRRFRLALPAVCFLLLLRPVAAAETALDAVSSDAGVVVRLKNPKATIDKVSDLVNLVVPGAGEQFRSQFEALGPAISNPGLAGVDREADWWVAVYPKLGDQEPGIVYVIPATDLKAMKEGLPASTKFIEYGKFGVYTEDADSADKTTALIKGTGKSIVSLVAKESSAVFEKGDVSVFLNVTRLMTVYRDQITEARERAGQNLENVPSQSAGMNTKVIADAFNELLTALLQGLNDTESCTIAAVFSNEGIAFEDLVRVASGSKTDKLLQQSPANPIGLLGSLPAGGSGYFGLQGNLTDLASFGMKMSGAMLGDNGQNSKEFEAVANEMKKLKFGAIASSLEFGPAEEGTLRTVALTEVTEPGKLRELSQKLIKLLGTVQAGNMKQTYSFKPDAEKQGKNSVDVMTVTTDVSGADGDPEAAMTERMMKLMYGPEGMISRTVYLKDKVVQANGGGKAGLEKALTALESKTGSVGGTDAFQKARGQVAEKANLLVLFDLPGTIVKALEAVVESGTFPLPLNTDVLKSLDLKSSFLGLSIATEAQGLRVKTNIPVEQAQGVAKIVLTLMGQLNAGAQ